MSTIRIPPTYEAVCWTCGLESDSLDWARRHSANGQYAPGMEGRYAAPEKRERHAVRVTMTQDTLFNHELN